MEVHVPDLEGLELREVGLERKGHAGADFAVPFYNVVSFVPKCTEIGVYWRHCFSSGSSVQGGASL
jgi:hypothetical protein